MKLRSGSQPVDMALVERAGKLFRNGWSTNEVCEVMQISRAAASEYKRMTGNVDRANGRKSAISLQDVANINLLRSNGITWTVIAAHLGFNPKAMQRECRINEVMRTELPQPTIASLPLSVGNSAWNELHDQ